MTLEEQVELDRHEKDLARIQQANLEEEQRKLRSQSKELHPDRAQALENAKAVLARPVPGTAAAATGGSAPKPSETKLTDGSDVPPLREGEKMIQSSKYWYIFEHGGTKYVRFFAPEARSPNGAKKGGRGDGVADNGSALLTPEGRIYVEEGQHRLNGVVLEGTTNMSSVAGHPKWLEYEYHGTTTANGHPPAYNTEDGGKPWVNINKENPWDGEEGY